MAGMGAFTWLVMKEIIDMISGFILRKCIANPDQNKERIQMAVDSIWQIIYFSMSVAWGYSFLSVSRWLPSFLGGKHPRGALEATYESLLFIDTPPGCHCYILFNYGYHVLDFFNHLKGEKKEDWREVFLQHLVVLMMYPAFFLSNLMGIGVLVSWIHDIADIFFNLCRLLNMVGPSFLYQASYALLIIVWTYTRSLVLPYFIYKIITEARYPEKVSHFQPLIWLQVILLLFI